MGLDVVEFSHVFKSIRLHQASSPCPDESLLALDWAGVTQVSLLH